MPTLLVTGSSGLIGSQAVRFFSARGWRVYGIDNNMRREFFGPGGDTTPVLEALRRQCSQYTHRAIDIRAREAVDELVRDVRPDLIVHCAAQPSHDLAARRPFDDFDVNAGGTLALLEAARNHCPDAVFVFLSTNKVYGDAPNEKPLVELATRFDYADPEDAAGIDEQCRIDTSLHSLFGASKLAADILVQEYGRYFGMPTVCLRAGCLTGPQHAGVELHGFLSYLVRAAVAGRRYTIYGYKGKQVRDQLHAEDVCRAIEQIWHAPRCAEVYNLGGGRENSISVLEAISRVEDMLGGRMDVVYEPQARRGDHICYISDTGKFRAHYPEWSPQYGLKQIFEELVGAATGAVPAAVA